MSNSTGMPTNAVYGFIRKLESLCTQHKPEYLVAVFDSPGDCFRNEIYPDYKANREEAPDEFRVQLPYIFKVLDAMGVQHCQLAGFEADDLIGTLAQRATEAGFQTVIVSADKDLFQLVSDDVTMLRSLKHDTNLYDAEAVFEKMRVHPYQIADYLGMVGDSSDNIPGVRGIGPKAAEALLGQFGTVEQMLSNTDDIENKRRRGLIEEGKDHLLLSRDLASIRCNAPLDLDLQSLLRCDTQDMEPLIAIYKELGFEGLIKQLRDKQHNGDGQIDSAVSDTVEENYRVVSDNSGLEQLVDSVLSRGLMAIDTETTGLDVQQADLVGISISCQSTEAWYIPIGHDLLSQNTTQCAIEDVREALNKIFAEPDLLLIAQNAKYDSHILRRHGFAVRDFDFDTMLASYVLNPEGRHGLKAMALQHLGVEMTEIKQLIGSGRSTLTMDQVPIDQAAPYACADADITLRLYELFQPRLLENGLQQLFSKLEVPLIAVLESMEREGIALDVSVLKTLSTELKSKLETLSSEIHTQAGRAFNIKSPKQVGVVLFEEIGLKTGKKTKTGYSTSSDVLEELKNEHVLPGLILEYRHYDKLLSTYVDALPLMINSRTRRIHTSYNQFVAATGRLSSTDPNLQNIPARTEHGRRIRSAFIPNNPGDILLAADYSQIELRVLAHVTGDKTLHQAFIGGVDIHTQTAMSIFNTSAELLTRDMRSQAKVVNFGVLYGMSAHRLSGELKIDRKQAQRFIDDYFETYPGVQVWSDALIEKAIETGYVETLGGRRRMVPNLTVKNRLVQANARRMAVNTPIQGTAADLIKQAMIELDREIRESGRESRMVLQVHDELVFSVPESEVDEFSVVVREKMESAMALDVPLLVEIKTGRNWAEC